jgi:hypothetical protein
MTDIVQASDGLSARVIKSHTLDKFDRHKQRDLHERHGRQVERAGPPGSRLGHLELFAGPGIAICDGEEFDGCPLIAATHGTLFAKLANGIWDDSGSAGGARASRTAAGAGSG